MSITLQDSSLPSHESASAESSTAFEPAPMVISKRVHLIVLVLCATVVGLAMTMSIQNQEKVSLPFAPSSLPELCHLKRMFHVPCPGCGLTRSFIAMGHFDLYAAASFNVVGIPLFLLTLLQIPYRAYWLLRRDRRLFNFNTFRYEGAFMISLAVMLVAQWLVRMAYNYWW